MTGLRRSNCADPDPRTARPSTQRVDEAPPPVLLHSGFDEESGGQMEHRGRCCVCRKHYRAEPRVGARQVTCGSAACRRTRKIKTDRRWRGEHPEYFRRRREEHADARDRRSYSREYRARHPESQERNTEQVRAHRLRVKACRVAVSSASREIRVILRDSRGYVPIEAVSSAIGEIQVTLGRPRTSGSDLGNEQGAAM